MNEASTELSYNSVAEKFIALGEYKDSQSLAEQCKENAETCRKDSILADGKSKINGTVVTHYEEAIKIFQTISGWRDADELINVCQRKIDEIKAKEEADRLERERKAELARIEAEKAAKKRKKIIAIVTPVICACIAFVIILITVIIPNFKYNSAMELYEAQKYDAAITDFKALNGYKDSENKIAECEAAITDNKYNSAIADIKKGNIVKGYKGLIALNGYKDSAEKANEIYEKYKTEIFKVAEIGDIIFFGTYEQDNNTKNGKEDNKLLIISKYAIESQKYSSFSSGYTWENCSLRKWLNKSFFDNAFTPDEKEYILTSTISADENPEYSSDAGNDTEDKVFLLSTTEVKKYFESGNAQCSGTAYCYSRGIKKSENGNCWWWLRTPGRNTYGGYYCAAGVGSDGSISYEGNGVNIENAVRPAMWIDISK